MKRLLRMWILPSFSPSYRLYPPVWKPYGLDVMPEAANPRAFLRQAQDKFTLAVLSKYGSDSSPARGARGCAARGCPMAPPVSRTGDTDSCMIWAEG